MTLELDTRQRAMLQEMGVHVWLPESGVAILAAAAAASPAAMAPQRQPAAPPRPAAPVPVAPVAAPAARSAQPVSAPVATDAAALDWTALTETVQACQACGLCAGRSHTTLWAPAEPLLACDWMVVGDVPDEDEDRAGAPFAGADGLLLANMLRALGLQRANPLAAAAPAASGPAAAPAQRAYVSNVLKCHPARGAMVQATELAQCASYLQREIALVQPKIILSMGRFANQLLLGDTPELAMLPLGKLRGTLHRYQGVPVVVTYHPKTLMRNSADKAKAWADLCLAATKLEP
jgi:DNA polymerase